MHPEVNHNHEASLIKEVSPINEVAFSSSLPISWLILTMLFVTVLYLKLLVAQKKKRVSRPSSANSIINSCELEMQPAHVPYQNANLSSIECALDACVIIADKAVVEMPTEVHWMSPSYESLHWNYRNIY